MALYCCGRGETKFPPGFSVVIGVLPVCREILKHRVGEAGFAEPAESGLKGEPGTEENRPRFEYSWVPETLDR